MSQMFYLVTHIKNTDVDFRVCNFESVEAIAVISNIQLETTIEFSRDAQYNVSKSLLHVFDGTYLLSIVETRDAIFSESRQLNMIVVMVAEQFSKV